MKELIRRNIKQAGIFFLVALFCLPPVLAQGEGDGSLPAPLAEKELQFVSTSSWCLTDTECSFTVVLPEIVPSQVAIGNPVLPAGVSFVSASKNLWIEGRASGTILELVLSFSQGGSIQLPSLEVLVEGQLYAIPFAPVDVFQNPKSLKPQLELSFHDQLGNELVMKAQDAVAGKKALQLVAGTPVFITVQLRYAAALEGFSWDLTPQALFQQVESYEESFDVGAQELSHQLQPVAQFSFIPLKTGVLQLPTITLEVRGYDENRHTLSTGAISVVSLQAPEAFSSSSDTASAAAFASAFAPPAITEEEPVPEVDQRLAQQLALLRWKERVSLPWSSATLQRQQFEQELSLTSGTGERSLPLGYLGLGLSLVTFIVTMVAIFKKKIFLSVLLGFLCILVFISSMVYLKPSFQPAGILAANNLSRIPEPDATHLFPVTPYSVVQIQQEVLGWYYVEAAGLEGWIPRELVIPIQKQGASAAQKD